MLYRTQWLKKVLRIVVINSLIYYVESFNNTLNIYKDKRVAFGSDQYKVRALLGTYHQNEIVGSWKWNPSQHCCDPKAPRRKVGKTIYKKWTHQFRKNIWKRYNKSVFSKGKKQLNLLRLLVCFYFSYKHVRACGMQLSKITSLCSVISLDLWPSFMFNCRPCGYFTRSTPVFNNLESILSEDHCIFILQTATL